MIGWVSIEVRCLLSAYRTRSLGAYNLSLCTSVRVTICPSSTTANATICPPSTSARATICPPCTSANATICPPVLVSMLQSVPHSCLKWPLEEICNLIFEHLTYSAILVPKLEHLTRIFFLSTFFHGND